MYEEENRQEDYEHDDMNAAYNPESYIHTVKRGGDSIMLRVTLGPCLAASLTHGLLVSWCLCRSVLFHDVKGDCNKGIKSVTCHFFNK